MSETHTHDFAASAVGIEHEHEAQMRLLDQIERAVLSDAGATAVGPLLDDFVEHANAHFLSEQLLMRNHAYGAYEQHVREHDMLLAQARQFMRDVGRGQITDAYWFVASLRNWLTVHMKTTDAAFETYLGLLGEKDSEGELP